MNYIGIDIAKRRHALAVVDGEGRRLGETIALANDEEGFRGALAHLRGLGVEAGDAVACMEATGHYWMALYTFLVDHGFEVAVVNPLLIDAFRKGDTLRKTKTDAVDALLIARYAREKRARAAAMPPEAADGLKHLSRYRTHVVKERSALKNRLAAVVDRVFPEFPTLFAGGDIDCATARALLALDPTPAGLASTDVRTIERTAREASRGRHGREFAERVKDLARRSVGVPYASRALAFEIRHVVDLVGYMDGHVAEIEREMDALLASTPGRWLKTVPGVGVVTAAAIAGEVGDPWRFESPRKLIAYAGMDATKHDSGERAGSTGRMSKRGSSSLRYALMEAADGARRHDEYFGAHYEAKRAEGKAHYVALSSVARKLAGVALTLMREQRPYESRPPVKRAGQDG